MAAEVESLQELYVEELRDLYNAEMQITKALPKIIKHASSPELKRGLEENLYQTQNRVSRLDRIFEMLGKSPRGKKCVGMEGVLQEGNEVMSEKWASPDLMDAALIGGCQKVEHYEISGYGTARAFAKLLGDNEGVNLISQTLEEEKAADEKLTRIGENIINVNALHESKQGNTRRGNM